MSPTKVPVSEIRTPFLAVDPGKLAKNISAMQRRADDAGSKLRPHFKSHRSLRLARDQLRAGAIGMTCATLHQAEVLTDSGIRGVLVAAPVVVDSANLGLVNHLHHVGSVTFGVDSEECLTRLARVADGTILGLAIEVECGARRTGVAPRDVASLAISAQTLGLEVRTLFTYPGHCYDPGGARAAHNDEIRALRGAQSELRDSGLGRIALSGGSTPTMRFVSDDGLVDEYRPGTYVFGDRQQVALGAMAVDEVAAAVVATVISTAPGRMVIDAGAKALGRDRPLWLEGFGALRPDKTAGERDPVLVSRLYDHHGVFDLDTPLEVGDRVAVMPNNINSAVSLHPQLWFVSAEDAERVPVDVDREC